MGYLKEKSPFSAWKKFHIGEKKSTIWLGCKSLVVRVQWPNNFRLSMVYFTYDPIPWFTRIKEGY